MTWKRIIILVVLSFFSSAGCAGLNRPPQTGPRDMSPSAKADEETHAELERELSLYSD